MINLFTIKEDTCVGCNMCSLVCPVEGCITMQEVDTGRPPMSWNEYQAKLARGRGRRDRAAAACVSGSETDFLWSRESLPDALRSASTVA